MSINSQKIIQIITVFVIMIWTLLNIFVSWWTNWNMKKNTVDTTMYEDIADIEDWILEILESDSWIENSGIKSIFKFRSWKMYKEFII